MKKSTKHRAAPLLVATAVLAGLILISGKRAGLGEWIYTLHQAGEASKRGWQHGSLVQCGYLYRRSEYGRKCVV